MVAMSPMAAITLALCFLLLGVCDWSDPNEYFDTYLYLVLQASSKTTCCGAKEDDRIHGVSLQSRNLHLVSILYIIIDVLHRLQHTSRPTRSPHPDSGLTGHRMVGKFVSVSTVHRITLQFTYALPFEKGDKTLWRKATNAGNERDLLHQNTGQIGFHAAVSSHLLAVYVAVLSDRSVVPLQPGGKRGW